ncbi:hypothetical protein [Chryseobacterium sp. WX]|uniref:hypothetical protein n=1 Tax=Chryseobacterium sp. WX TaxID=3031803 RepID=UPI002409CDB8|nr:hypothetical protein [Chryseobacterium sp. WX]WFB65886.1 hypothetical protein PZ898_14195 [Chryseobacterium sp. WX]
MNKKFILRLLLLVTVSLFFFNSCRTDEVTQEEKRTEREKIEAFSRFENNLASQKKSQKGSSEYISYHEPFKEIIQTFMKNNPSYSKRFNDDVGEIYFNLRSITYGETTKGIAYPIIKDGSVNAVLVGLVNPKRDWVNFIVLKNNSPEVQSIITNFQNVYNSPTIASRGGQPEQTEDILPVIITVYGDITGPVNHYYQPYVDYGSNGGGMSGGSETYGGAGGSQTQNPQDPKNPCEKTTGIITNTTVKAKIDELKAQSTLGGEKGVKLKVDGTPSEIISGGAHSVNFGDKTGYAGGYHNHTPTGIPMLSPPDVDQLLGFARAQPTSNSENVKNAFVGMVAPNGMHYVIWFNGSYQDALTNYSQDNINGYILDYVKTESDLTDFAKNGNTYINSDGTINNLGVEKLFFETIKNMGLEGKVNLQRIENDGSVKNINLNGNNQPTSTTC